MKFLREHMQTLIAEIRDKGKRGEKVNKILLTPANGDAVSVELYREFGTNGGCAITAYCGEDIVGVLDTICRGDTYLDIDQFGVSTDLRKCGLGKALLDELVKGAEIADITEIHVEPHPDYKDWLPTVSIPILYEKYKKLGFQFVENESKLDISKPDHKMIYKRKQLCD